MRRRKTGAAQQATDARGNFTPPSRAEVPASEPQTPAVPQSSGGWFSARNWRVATRLNVILLIPVLVALVFGGLDVKKSVDTWTEAEDAAKTARLVKAAAAYAHALIYERDVTAIPLLKGDTEDSAIKSSRAATDAARADFDDAAKSMPHTDSLERRLKTVRDAETKLGAIRASAFKDIKTEDAYGSIQRPLMAFDNELGLGTGSAAGSYGRTLYAVSLAKAAESLQRSIGVHLMLGKELTIKDRTTLLTSFSSYQFLEYVAMDEYKMGGSPADQQRMSSALAKADTDKLNGMVAAIMAGDTPAQLRAKGITAETWFTTATGKFNAYRSVEQHLADTAVNDVEQISASAQQDAFINGGVVVVALVVAFVVAGRMARSMSRSMRRLRGAAFEVAEQRLPALVDQLSRTDPGRVDTRVEAIPITTKDEIGEVARAFDQVHREAVRLAAEQALLRGNVNAIFTNLSRRNQGLIEGQLDLITSLENNEADPDQLENLFRLDHLATRMRRNGENLLILAGEEPGRRWDQPIPLVDVLRAASSEVEAYERIELAGIPEADIHGLAVTDLVHLLAELLENATSFSSPHTKVRVNATRLPDGRVMVEIHDKGIGLTAEDFADINHKLANPPTVDATISQRMGLFVVGRLAMRHGIRVQLRPSGEQAGTTSLVMLPDAITHGGGGEDQMTGDDFTVSRIVPEQQAADAGRLRTAAELGFDDSRYEAQPTGDAGGPDPLNRSRLREERRAALEEAQSAYDATAFPSEHPQQTAQQPFAPQQSYTEGAYQEPVFTDQQTYGDYNAPAYQGEWADSAPQAGPYQQEHMAGYPGQPESSPTADTVQPERVEFDRPGPASSGSPSLTGSGLPRREKQWQQPETGEEATRDGGEFQQPQHETGRQSRLMEEPGQSANDERWQRAERLKVPKADGVTSSGLPRRVPKANLVEGKAVETAQDGPQISRAPEDVRGRLANLRRGVQQGRSAGSDTSEFPVNPGHQQHQQHDQGFGPGGTYDQER
ncbi:nitrate- and nitrite sensing domain-containing protein [Streptomyces sp. NPDC052396]|uniref:sensor histidine kinase n=1 Tax=Streptomyces sp. NPDC052396 TaxID=3365689 RepID=UPI0037D4A367